MAAVEGNPYNTSTGQSQVTRAWSTSTQGGSHLSHQTIRYQQSPSTNRPSTAHDPGFRSKERLRQFHRLSAYQSSPDMIVTQPIVEQAQSHTVPSMSIKSSSPEEDKNKTPDVTVRRRKSNSVKSSFRKLFKRNSPSITSESAIAEDHHPELESTEWNIDSSSYHTPHRTATPEDQVSPTTKSRQSHSDASHTSPGDTTKQRNRLQRPRHAKPGVEREASPSMDAAPTIPVIVSSMERNVINEDRIWHYTNAEHGIHARSLETTSGKHAQEYQGDVKKSSASNPYENAKKGIYRGQQSMKANEEESPIHSPPRSKSVPNVASWTRQTEPRQVMEATSLAARIAEVENRLAEIEYAIHKLTRAFCDRSSGRQSGTNGRDSGPYLTPPSSQHEKLSADKGSSGRSSRSSSKKSRRKNSPGSPPPPELQDEVDLDTTPRATFLTSPSIDEFRQNGMSLERSPTYLRRTNSARNLNAIMKMHDPLNTVNSTSSALHREMKTIRAGVSAPAIRVSSAMHHDPPPNNTSLQFPVGSSLPLLSDSPHVHRSRHQHEATSRSPQPYFFNPASRFSAYETDDSVDDFATPAPDDQGTDADAEDNSTTTFSTERSSMEMSSTSPSHFYDTHQDQRSLRPPTHLPSVDRPATAGDAMTSENARASRRLVPRSAGARPFTPSDKKRNDDLRAFLDAGPPT